MLCGEESLQRAARLHCRCRRSARSTTAPVSELPAWVKGVQLAETKPAPRTEKNLGGRASIVSSDGEPHPELRRKRKPTRRPFAGQPVINLPSHGPNAQDRTQRRGKQPRMASHSAPNVDDPCTQQNSCTALNDASGRLSIAPNARATHHPRLGQTQATGQGPSPIPLSSFLISVRRLAHRSLGRPPEATNDVERPDPVYVGKCHVSSVRRENNWPNSGHPTWIGRTYAPLLEHLSCAHIDTK